MTKRVPSKRVRHSDVRAYAAKAQEHLDAARESLQAERWTAATTLAIHAAINAADAITGARLGKRSSGTHHEQVLSLLRDAGKEGQDAARHVRALLPLKTRTEYEGAPVRPKVAERAVRSAERILDTVRAVLETLPQPPS